MQWVKELLQKEKDIYPADIYLFKVNNRNTRTICEISSKLTNNYTRIFLEVVQRDVNSSGPKYFSYIASDNELVVY